jgi:predicted NBD/HSP70 family sugar kinase
LSNSSQSYILFVNDFVKVGCKSLYQQRTNRDVKRTNRNLVYKYLLEKGRLTIQQLSRALNISIPTITKNIYELIRMELVVESGEGDSTGGRRPKIVMPVAGAKIALGIDITQHHICIAAVDLVGNILKCERIRKDFYNEEMYYIEVADILNGFIEENALSKDKVIGAGIAIPGIISADEQTILASGVLEIREPMGNPFQTHISYDTNMYNEASAAAFIEWYGRQNGGNMVYVSLSNSVGGAVVIDNAIIPGDGQKSAEFGHIITHKGGKKCYCGRTGCYDSYGTALLLANLTDGNLGAFFEALEEENGTGPLSDVFSQYVDDLAFLVANLRTSYDSDIVLGGYVGSYLENYLDRIRARVSHYLNDGATDDFSYIKSCRYKVEASALGVAMRHVEKFINQV